MRFGLLLLPILTGLAGCAFSEDVEDVRYVPTQAAQVPGAGPIALSVTDARTANRTRISVKINGYGMDGAPIRASRPVTDIVRDALDAEFVQRGFRLEPGGTKCTVAVETFFNTYSLGFAADPGMGAVDLAVTVRGPSGAPLLQQTYHGQSHISAFLANGSNAASSVSAALQDALAQMFEDPAFISAILGSAPPT